MAFHPYLFFSGTCREAMEHYHRVLGGELEIMDMKDAPEEARMPGAADDSVMHAALTVDGAMLMASDDPTGDGAGALGVAVNWSTPDAARAEAVFAGLAEGGEVLMPFGPVFWSPGFGHVRDRFGIQWMVDVEAPAG